MNNFTKKSIYTLMLCLFSSASFAEQGNLSKTAEFATMENENFPEMSDVGFEQKKINDSVNIMFQTKLGLMFASPTTKDFSVAPSVPNPVAIPKLFNNAGSIEGTTTFFITPYLATELSLGFNLLRVNKDYLKSVYGNYNGDPAKIANKKNIYAIPLSVSIQFQAAPFGGIRPYIGAGYNATYFFKSGNMKFNIGHGPLFKIGANFCTKDDTLFGLEISTNVLSTKIRYDKITLANGANGLTPDLSSKVKINPVTVKLSFGYMF